MPQKATIRDWIFIVRELLQNANWPRLENINSIQYQAAQSIFAQLDVLANLQNKSKISFNRALEFIDFNLDQSSFAPQRKASAIQILGLLETTGLTFSHLWVCGMSAANFPSVSQLNPFIPRAIAQKSGLPRSAQDQELEFAQRTLNRWLNVEAELNFSYTRLDKNSPQLPSNLLLDAITPQDGLSADNQKQMPFAADHSLRNPIMVKQDIVLEASDDSSGTAITDPHIAGGTTTLKAHASCPFKAYAMFRLKLKQPREAKDFLDAVDRGNSLHKVLENLMRVYDDSNAITKITSAEINKQCGLVLKQYRGLPESFIANELDRISELVKQWLELEKKRNPFKINGVEEKFNLTLEGLTFSIKIDRIDTIDDQNVVIDYKSSSNSVTGAISEPLTDPQLPAYSLVPKKIAGVYFASINNKEVTLDGIALETGKLVAAKTKGFAIRNPDGTNIYSKESQIQWPDKVHTWQLELTQIAREIALGNAQVAPKKSACKHCHLTSFCRINDR
jgi:probable DNA repair protein